MSAIEPSRIEIALRPDAVDARGRRTEQAIRSHLGMEIGSVRTSDVMTFNVAFADGDLERVRRECTDPVVQVSAAPRVERSQPFDWLILVAFKPGVTDNVGRTAKSALGDILGRRLDPDESVHTATAYELTGGDLTRDQATHIGGDLLANLLIETVRVVSWDEWRDGAPDLEVPLVDGSTEVRVGRYDLSGGDDDLMRISREGTLSLSLAEMRAIRDHFADEDAAGRRAALDLDARPTDLELETMAQTWSEHCKHKIFSARIDYTDERGRSETIDSLFNTYIRGTTDEVARRIDWLVSVFHDNAGVVDFNDRLDVVYKVETHNSPSALEPYGGAMTGIVGCNRDPMGTGLGAELLINVWGYCFASPFTPPGDVPEGVMHPRRLRDGVHQGVIDGGNQSGLPYGVGWEFYDPRYLAKPMVYCGTVGLLPKRIPDGRLAAEKEARPGDLIVMTGGRIGKDGIHGATFSSEELHQDSPVQAVQIGDPLTQKKMHDFLLEVRDAGLFRAITDNGAGGLSSSIGEMAEGPGGADVDLACAPLKYAGLQPWEIWLSEAQERMTLAVPPENWDELAELARRRDVEAVVLGAFNDSGFLTLRYGDQLAGHISMAFLHDGCPRMELTARWTPPTFAEPEMPGDSVDLTGDLTDLMTRLNPASKEFKMRQYDHEVKGRTIIKPLVGRRRDVPSDATVFLAEYDGCEGIVLASAFNAHHADIDAGAMMAGVVDLAVRRVLAVGGRLDRIAALDNFCWPDPVESSTTPDGAYKLAQLVRACQALRETCVAYGVPLISGKDSMKNDSTRGGRKISIPLSVLVSTIGKIDDVDRALTLEAKAVGDTVYVLGSTRAELGGSEYAHLLNERRHGPSDQLRPEMAIGGRAPSVDGPAFLSLYRAVESAAREGLVRSLHAVGLGGLAAGLSLVALGGELGLEIDLGRVPTEEGDGAVALTDAETLFSESAGRLIATVAPERAEAFEAALTGHPFAAIGRVTASQTLTVTGHTGAPVITADLAELKTQWQAPLAGV